MAKLEFDDSMGDISDILNHIEIDCPKCNHPLEISANDADSVIKCPHCNSEIKIESE